MKLGNAQVLGNRLAAQTSGTVNDNPQLRHSGALEGMMDSANRVEEGMVKHATKRWSQEEKNRSLKRRGRAGTSVAKLTQKQGEHVSQADYFRFARRTGLARLSVVAKGETPHSRIALMNGMPYWSATQSASTSTNHSRLMKPFTSTKVVVGRIAAKNSPCARAAASHCEISVNMIRVRTTVLRERPASTTASAMISRQRLVWP